MTNLSNAAQEVFWAYNREASGKPDDHHMLEAIAAALRAVANQVVPETPSLSYPDDYESGAYEANQWARIRLLAIAAELEEFAIQ